MRQYCYTTHIVTIPLQSKSWNRTVTFDHCLVSLTASAGPRLATKGSAGTNALGPGGTLLVNIAGAFVLGLFAGTSGTAATIVGTAGLGALTTVSGILGESARLSRASPVLALGYVSLTITGATAAAYTGLTLV